MKNYEKLKESLTMRTCLVDREGFVIVIYNRRSMFGSQGAAGWKIVPSCLGPL